MGLVPVLAESPVWLMHKGRAEGARKNLLLLRTSDSIEACEGVLDDLQDAASDERHRGSDLASDASAVEGGACAQLVCSRGPGRTALMIGIGLMFAQQWSGINAVMFYCGTILQTIFPDPQTANRLAIGVQALQLAVTLASALFMDRAGRKPLLILAAVGMAGSAALLAAYYITQVCVAQGADGADLHCVPVLGDMVAVAALYGFVLFYACGMGAIPWFLMGEIFPAGVKGQATAVCTGVNWLLAFSVTKSVTVLESWFGGAPHGMGWVFACYASVAALTVVFVWLCVPETKGKSLSDIQTELATGKVRARRPEEVAENPSASLSLTWPFTFFKVFQGAGDEPENLWGCMSVDEDADHSGRSGSQLSES